MDDLTAWVVLLNVGDGQHAPRKEAFEDGTSPFGQHDVNQFVFLKRFEATVLMQKGILAVSDTPYFASGDVVDDAAGLAAVSLQGLF